MSEIGAHDKTSSPAPGDLELVRRFMNLHEHGRDSESDVPPRRETFERFLRERGLLDERTGFTDADRRDAHDLQRALRAKVRVRAGEPMPGRDVRVIETVAGRAGLRLRFGGARPRLVPGERGVAGAFGLLVATAFLTDLDGTWRGLKECASETCSAVFFDRSKNRSGRWCSMATCGNRAKVRAWRDRRRVPTGP